jgi:hypothetical protein
MASANDGGRTRHFLGGGPAVVATGTVVVISRSGSGLHLVVDVDKAVLR